jgi:methylenetetrahydrofolate dehydrogenase (NADP+)/methenyltetrahydrofolate cyclohydrolase
MTARIMTGQPTADRLLARAAAQVMQIRIDRGHPPVLALIGTDAPAAQAYVRRIALFADIAGIEARMIALPAAPGDAVDCIRSCNADPSIDGILLLSPLPPGLSLATLAAALDPAKDVDGLTATNAGRLARGVDGLFPCTPQAAILLAEEEAGTLRGRTATVVGASAGVGMPLAEMLVQRGATVTIAHADTRDLPAACRSAELLFVAVGKPGLIGAAHVAPGTVVIDIGINAVDNGSGGTMIVGDVDPVGVAGIARAISAVPDGVGPLTAAFLIHNTVQAALHR